MNRSLTMKSGQCHVHRYMKPLLERIQKGDIDPSFVVTHRMHLEAAPGADGMFVNKDDQCVKIVSGRDIGRRRVSSDATPPRGVLIDAYNTGRRMAAVTDENT